MMAPMTGYRDRLYGSYFSSHYASTNPAGSAALRADYRMVAEQLYVPLFPARAQPRIVDCATGTGLLPNALRELGYTDVLGIDISAEQVRAATEQGFPVRQGDVLEHLAGVAGELDVVLAIDLIEHLTRDELLAFLDAARAALTSGGALIVRCPNAGSPFGARLTASDLTHETAFSRLSLLQALRVCGFTQIRIISSDVRRPGPAYAPLYAARWLFRAVWRLGVALEWGPQAGREETASLNLVAAAYRT